jgi:hypothetical protein
MCNHAASTCGHTRKLTHTYTCTLLTCVCVCHDVHALCMHEYVYEKIDAYWTMYIFQVVDDGMKALSALVEAFPDSMDSAKITV